jgi:predicted Zn-dependent protease
VLVVSSSAAQGQDGAKALNIFQQLLVRPGAAPVPPGTVPTTPGVPGVPGVAGSSASAAATGNQAMDLISLLTQSTETIDEAREIEIGRQLAAVLLGSKPLYPDMALQRYVNQLGRWISLQSSRPDLAWTFAVLDDGGYNAFAAPGGYIFVTKGLIDRVADESELAGILAHEIAHVVQRHHLQAMRKTARAGFDPYGLVAVLQQLRTATPDNPVFTLSLSTHPAPQARLDQVELAMGRRLDAFTGKTAVPVQQRIDMLAQAEQRRAAATAAAAAAIARPAASPAAPAKGPARPTAKPAARTAGTTKKP